MGIFVHFADCPDMLGRYAVPNGAQIVKELCFEFDENTFAVSVGRNAVGASSNSERQPLSMNIASQ